MAAELVERIRQAEREAENIERQGDEQASAGCGRPERKRPPIGAEFSMRRRAGGTRACAAPGRRARPSDAPRRKRPRPLAES